MAAKRCKKCGTKSSKKEKICPECGNKKKAGLFGRLLKYTAILLVGLAAIGTYTANKQLANMTPEERATYDAEQAAKKAAKAEEQRLEAEAKAKADEEARLVAEAEAAEKAKAEEEARLAAEAEAKAEAEELARIAAEKAAEQQRIADEFKASGEAPYVRTTGTVTGDHTIDVEIETNIPFDFETGVSVSLVGQPGDEIAIGTSMKKLTVVDGSAATALDTREHIRETNGLPSGEYELYAKFYPRWQENAEIAALLDLGEESIGTSSIITLVGSGESADDVKARDAAQSWAMLNLNVGDEYGTYSELPDLVVISTVEKNASVNFVYHYSELADMTVVVNSFTKKIVTWHFGRVTESP